MSWFEALPSPADADAGRRSRDLERLAGLREAGVDRLLVPEVLDGQHETVDNVAFARAAGRAARLPVTAALCLPPRSRHDVLERAEQAKTAGIDSLLLVGATHRAQPMAGPDVEGALRILPQPAGVVTIPSRRRWRIDEPHRLLRKQRAGARFAVTQILFDATEALDARRAYLAALAPWEAPLPIVYSLAPVRRLGDLEFLRLLGVDVPQALDRGLREAPPEQRSRVAREASLGAARELAEAHEEEGLGPWTYCVSHVMTGNVEPGIALAAAVQDQVVQVPLLA